MEQLDSIKLNTRGLSSYTVREECSQLVVCGPDRTVKTFDFSLNDWKDIQDTQRAYKGLFIKDEQVFLIDNDNSIVIEGFHLDNLESTGIVVNIDKAASTFSESRNFAVFLSTDELLVVKKRDFSYSCISIGQHYTMIRSNFEDDKFYIANEECDMVELYLDEHEVPRTKTIELRTHISESPRLTTYCVSRDSIIICLTSNNLCEVNLDDNYQLTPIDNLSLPENTTFITWINNKEVALQFSSHVSIFDTHTRSITLNFDYQDPAIDIRENNSKLFIHDMTGTLNIYNSIRVTVQEEVPTKAPQPTILRMSDDSKVKAPEKRLTKVLRVEKPKSPPMEMQIQRSDSEDRDEELLRQSRDESLYSIEKKEVTIVKSKKLLMEEDEEESDLKDKDIDFDAIERFAEEVVAESSPLLITQPKTDMQVETVEDQPEERNLMLFETKLAEKDKQQQSRHRVKAFKYINDDSIGAKVQTAVVSGSYGSSKDSTRILCLNDLGQVSTHKYDDTNTLIVEYKDNNLHKKQVISNQQGFDLADMSLTGYILASRGSTTTEDDYEDELNSHPAVLYYHSIQYDNEWSVEFNNGDTLQLVSISNQYIVVLNANNLIRIYSHGGSELYNFSVDSPVVSISTFENYVSSVTVVGLPLFGCQQLLLKTYDISGMRVVYETKVSITPYSRLSWFGYSDDGVLHTQDSEGCIRVLTNRSIWVTVYEDNSDRRFWLIGVMDSDLVGYRLGLGETVPTTQMKYAVIKQSPRVYKHNAFDDVDDMGTQVTYDSIRTCIEREKYINYRNIKNSISNNPYHKIFNERILTPAQIDALDDANDVKRIELVRNLTIKGHKYAGIYEATQIKSEANFEVVLQLLEKIKHKKLAEELKTVANESGLFAYLSTQVQRTATEVSAKKQNNKKMDEWIAKENYSDEESKNYFKAEQERLATVNKHENGDSKNTVPVTQKPKDSKKRPYTNNLLFDLNHKASQEHSKAFKKINR